MPEALKSFGQFLESTVKSMTFTFGRFQPPTVGHAKLLDAVASAADGGAYQIYASQSEDDKKNPLSYEEKIKVMRKMFPKHARQIILDKKVNNALQIASKLYDDGYTKITMVVGSDRVPEFKRILTTYENRTLKDGYYSFPDGIEVVSAGERDPDADGVEGMSASKMRQAAVDGNLKAFISGIPKGYPDPQELFNLLRKKMGLKALSEFRQHVQLAPVSGIRDEFVRGEKFLIGETVRIKGSARITKIIARGPNFIVTEGSKKHWLTDVESITEGWARNQFNNAATGHGKPTALLYIDRHDERVELTKPAEINNALANIDKLDQKYVPCFKIFRNLNNAIVFQEVAWVPFFHLI